MTHRYREQAHSYSVFQRHEDCIPAVLPPSKPSGTLPAVRFQPGKTLMHAIMLKAKLHRAEVTHAVLDYEGSCAIDGEWLDLSGIREYEQIQIYNVDNGERFTTYAIRGEEGSRMISVNGAAAHKAKVGDRVIICAYAHYSEAELVNFKPRMLYMAPGNELSHTSNAIPVQLA
jgi:aspartate 1-decarboxylase